MADYLFHIVQTNQFYLDVALLKNAKEQQRKGAQKDILTNILSYYNIKNTKKNERVQNLKYYKELLLPNSKQINSISNKGQTNLNILSSFPPNFRKQTIAHS